MPQIIRKNEHNIWTFLKIFLNLKSLPYFFSGVVVLQPVDWLRREDSLC